MSKVLKSGQGWRIGWRSDQELYQGLVGGEDWAYELTTQELIDFRRLLDQLVKQMSDISTELMDGERIAIEAESKAIWLQLEGFSHSYAVRLILNGDRRCEGNWPPSVVPELIQASQNLEFF